MTDIEIHHDQDYRSHNNNYSDMNIVLESQNKIILDNIKSFRNFTNGKKI